MRIRRQWRTSELREIAKRYTSRNAFKLNDTNAYEMARRYGLLNTICEHMPQATAESLTKWSMHMLITEAKKYQRRIDFCRGSNKAYTYAYRNGVLNNICTHMRGET